MKKRFLVVIFISALAVAGAATWWFMRPHDTTPQPQANPTPIAKQEEKKIQLALPGADPIEALIEDYNDPTSPWVVVNKDYPLTKQDYKPTDLTIMTNKSRTDKGNDERSIRAVVAADFNDLIAASNAAGYDIIIGSGFRPYSLQAYYYNHYVSVAGEAEANKYSAKPGQSEHQTGLAADITLRSMECYLTACFGATPAGKWLAAHAVDYGFILRYPADKTEITKYEYEPAYPLRWQTARKSAPTKRSDAGRSSTISSAAPHGAY